MDLLEQATSGIHSIQVPSAQRSFTLYKQLPEIDSRRRLRMFAALTQLCSTAGAQQNQNPNRAGMEVVKTHEYRLYSYGDR